MVNYEEFKEMVYEELANYIPDAYKDRTPVFRVANKVNQKRDSISLEGKFEKELTPVIYLDDLYEYYKKCGVFQEVMKRCAEHLCSPSEDAPSLSPEVLDKEKVIFQLINREQNKEMLKNLPHRDIEDLSVIYRCVVQMNENGIASFIVQDGLVKSLGVTEEELFALAKENTKNLLPIKVTPLHETLRKDMEEQGMAQELIDIMVGEMPIDETLYVITNEMGLDGAAVILYDEVLHDLSEKIGSNLYVIPSSIHEMLAISTNKADPEELAQLVTDINMNVVKLSERLSNQVYHYDKELRKLSLATDTPNKMLDAVVAEDSLNYNASKKVER